MMIGELFFSFFLVMLLRYFFKLKSLLSVFLLTFNVNVKGGGVSSSSCRQRTVLPEHSLLKEVLLLLPLLSRKRIVKRHCHLSTLCSGWLHEKLVECLCSRCYVWEGDDPSQVVLRDGFSFTLLGCEKNKWLTWLTKKTNPKKPKLHLQLFVSFTCLHLWNGNHLKCWWYHD